MSSLDIRARLTETVTVKRISGHSAAGDPMYGAAVTMKARVERARLEASDGEGRRSSDAPDLYTVEALQIGELVWFAEDDTADVNDSHRVVACVPLKALDGTLTHYETRLS